jgi:hypothetical protein
MTLSRYTARQRHEVCSAAMARLFGDTSAHACVSLALVVLWSGVGPDTLRRRATAAMQATGRAIARGAR